MLRTVYPYFRKCTPTTFPDSIHPAELPTPLLELNTPTNMSQSHLYFPTQCSILRHFLATLRDADTAEPHFCLKASTEHTLPFNDRSINCRFWHTACIFVAYVCHTFGICLGNFSIRLTYAYFLSYYFHMYFILFIIYVITGDCAWMIFLYWRYSRNVK